MSPVAAHPERKDSDVTLQGIQTVLKVHVFFYDGRWILERTWVHDARHTILRKILQD
jgi:hypothetical protein